jgi:hypothetical protein
VLLKWLNNDGADVLVQIYQIGDAVKLESGAFSNQRQLYKKLTIPLLVLRSLGYVLK